MTVSHDILVRLRPSGVAARVVSGLLVAVTVAVTVAALLAGCSGSTAGSSAPPSASDVAAMLARHGRAVLDHDRATVLAGLDPGRAAATFRAQQSAEYTNVAALPFTHWSYALGSQVGDSGIQAAARRRYGATAVVFAVTLSVALRGVDPLPTTHKLWWTFVRRGANVVVAGDTDVAQAGGISWRGPWDFGPIEAYRGTHSLVLGHSDRNGQLQAIAADVDAAVPVVTRVWGTSWPRDVAVIVPASQDELDAALGAAPSTQVEDAAAAVNDGQDPVSGTVLGQRLVVEPDAFDKLSPLGARIVVQHEVTHLASAAATTAASPRWLVEGFADYVGNLAGGQSVGVVAAELRTQVRRGVLPATLPTEAQFDDPASAARSYEASWLACRLIAARIGVAGLVRFYRQVGASPDDSTGAVAAATRSLLGETTAAFVTRWRAYLRAELG